MKIGIYQFEPEQGRQLATLLQSQGHTTKKYDGTTQDEDTWSEAEALCVFVGCEVNEKTLQGFPKVKIVLAGSTGFDRIDLDYCRQKGITVCNVPAYGADTVAEHSMALLLSMTRKIPQLLQNAKEKNYCLEGVEGTDLNGKTIGVIGTGRIGCNMIQIAKGFDMNVVAFDLYPNEQRAKDMGFEYKDLETLLTTCDVLSLHVPATPETQHLIDKDTVQKMKKGMYLVNTARGEIIDNKALLYGLENNVFAGVAIDVIDEESLLFEKNTPNKIQQSILDDSRVLFTPHAGFCTVEAKRRIIETVVSNIQAFESGTPKNVL